MDKTGIQWTDATWNPTRGCRRISPGCINCYAEKVAARFCGDGLPYHGLIKLGKWNGEARFVADKLNLPLQWRKPRRIFVDSMSDLFYEGFDDWQIAAVFGVMARAHWHTFQILTKRPDRALRWCKWWAERALSHAGGGGVFAQALPAAQAVKGQSFTVWAGPDNPKRETMIAPGWPLPNVWIGASVENQEYADKRIPDLLKIPAAVRFISYEPALGPVNFDLRPMRSGCGPEPIKTTGIDWLIVGGESGHDARLFDIAWARSAVAQCSTAGVPVFVKQMGARPSESGKPALYRDIKGGDMSEWPEDLRVRDWPAVRPCP